MMVWLPGEPNARNGLPSCSTMVGVMEESGVLRGAMASASPKMRPEGSATPGWDAKSPISLLSRKPSPVGVTLLPYWSFSV